MPSGQLAERIRRRLGMNPLILDPGTLIKSMFQLRVRGGRTFTTFRACADEWLALRKTKVVNRAFAEGVVYEYRCGAGDHLEQPSAATQRNPLGGGGRARAWM